jgi:hypothetical protein
MAIETIKYQGNDYATVPQRLKEFRSTNPRALIETKPTIEGDMVIFEARIKSDQSDPSSPEATGHSYGKTGDKKGFEKQETVAVGRALSLLGYLNDGQIASTEEMEEFESFKEEKFTEALKAIGQATKREEFTAIMANLTPDQKREATPIINARIKELKDANTSTSPAA